MIKQKLQKKIAEALGFLESEITLEHPEVFAHGDLSTNIALVKSKELNKNPKELAEDFVAKLKLAKLPDVSKIEAAGPGFINLHLSRDFFIYLLNEFSFNKNFGENNLFQG